MAEILLACEYSGIVRDAFISKGHRVVSCDFLPTERPGPHYQGDVRDILYSRNWDAIIAHPSCTFLSYSGVRWLYDKSGEKVEERWANLDSAIRFFRLFQQHPCKRKALENPTPHRHAVNGWDGNGWLGIGQYTQAIQPFQFGHTTSKRTCLWLTGLPPLVPTQIIPKEERTSDVHRAAPGPNRWKERSRTFQGIANAMAQQWGELIN